MKSCKNKKLKSVKKKNSKNKYLKGGVGKRRLATLKNVQNQLNEDKKNKNNNKTIASFTYGLNANKFDKDDIRNLQNFVREKEKKNNNITFKEALDLFICLVGYYVTSKMAVKFVKDAIIKGYPDPGGTRLNKNGQWYYILDEDIKEQTNRMKQSRKPRRFDEYDYGIEDLADRLDDLYNILIREDRMYR